MNDKHGASGVNKQSRKPPTGAHHAQPTPASQTGTDLQECFLDERYPELGAVGGVRAHQAPVLRHRQVVVDDDLHRCAHTPL